MIKFELASAILFLAVLVNAEPPAERLEGAKLDPALLARVKDLLIYDTPVSQAPNLSNGPMAGLSRAESPSGSYGSPGTGYDSMSFTASSAPFGQSGFDRSFNGASPMEISGGLSNSFPTNPNRAPAEEVTLSDPIPAPLLSTFDLSPTVEKRS